MQVGETSIEAWAMALVVALVSQDVTLDHAKEMPLSSGSRPRHSQS
jgi:hypothetical protein